MLIALIVAVAAWAQATPPPDTDIFLAPLTTVSGVLTVGAPVNVTSSPGYDNQPSFSPDGSALFFTSARGAQAATTSNRLQTDVYRYDIAARTTSRVTATLQSEYSPAVVPGGKHISVVQVELDGTQRLWRFTLDGREPELVLDDIKPVGYYAWVDAQTLVLFVLGKPNTLQIADVRSGKAVEVARDVGRAIQRMPGGQISFVQRTVGTGDSPPALSILELDPITRATRHLVAPPAGAREADTAWMPDGRLLMAHQDVLFVWKPGSAEWIRAADLGQFGLRDVTRLAVSPAGDRIAIVGMSK